MKKYLLLSFIFLSIFLLSLDKNNNNVNVLNSVDVEKQNIQKELTFGSSNPGSYIYSTSSPVDNGAAASALVTVPTTSLAVAGDLLIVAGSNMAITGTLDVASSSGQTWTALNQATSTLRKERMFWAQFNGNWNGFLRFSTGQAVNYVFVMHVFRPYNASSTWSVDNSEIISSYSTSTITATSVPVTISGITTNNNNDIVLARWSATDDVTWENTTAGWSVPGTAQYRNTSGTNDNSLSFAYKIQTTAGSTGDVSKNQNLLGPDPGMTSIISFKENEPISSSSPTTSGIINFE